MTQSSTMLWNIPKDVLLIIKEFLTNYEIIELLCLSKDFSLILGKKNLFTSITIHDGDDLFKYYKKYAEHSKSIKRTILYRINDPQIWWPFESEDMTLIDCKIPNKIWKHSDVVKKKTICNFL